MIDRERMYVYLFLLLGGGALSHFYLTALNLPKKKKTKQKLSLESNLCEADYVQGGQGGRLVARFSFERSLLYFAANKSKFNRS